MIGLFTYEMEVNADLIEAIDDEKWTTDGHQCQHYGYSHDYDTGMVGEPCAAIPNFLLPLRQSIAELCSQPSSYFNQCIIDEILPNHTITQHIDSANYGEIVCCVTLGSGCITRFEHSYEDEIVEPIYWLPNTVAILMNEARWEWTHGSVAAEYDVVDGIEIPRGRRIQLTLRHVVEAPVN
jgi:hypothetical protein